MTAVMFRSTRSARALIARHRPEPGRAIGAVLFAAAIGTSLWAFFAEASPAYRPWPVLGLWLVSIALFLLGVLCLDDERRKLDRLSIPRWEWAAIGVLTLIALLVRVIALGHVPHNFSGDEGAMGLQARAVLDGRLRDPFTSGWLSHPTLWFYIQAASVRVFGDDIFGLRIISALLGAATIPALYLFARRPFGARVALAAAALLALYHVHIHFSRMGLNNVADPLFALLAYTSLLEGLRRRSPLLLGLSGVFLGLDQHLYFAARLAPFVVLAVIAQRLAVERRRFLDTAHLLPLLVIGFFIGLGPLIRLPLFHWPDFTARLASEGIFESGWYHDRVAAGASPVHVLATQASRSVGAFGWVRDVTPHYNQGMSLLDPVSACIFAAGVVFIVIRFRRPESVLVPAWLLVTVIASALVVSTPGSEHYVTATPAICLAIACGLDGIVRVLGRLDRRLLRLATVAAPAVVVGLCAWSVTFYFHDYSPRNTFGFPATETATAVARYLAPHGQTSYVYLLGSDLFLNHPTLGFIDGDLQGTDVARGMPPDALPPPPAGRRSLFVAAPGRLDELSAIARARPGGRSVEVRSSYDERLLFRAYEAPA
jgi:4-amino-4-deoxy-L-arabinose transferase-like glycosyltransferase